MAAARAGSGPSYNPYVAGSGPSAWAAPSAPFAPSCSCVACGFCLVVFVRLLFFKALLSQR